MATKKVVDLSEQMRKMQDRQCISNHSVRMSEKNTQKSLGALKYRRIITVSYRFNATLARNNFPRHLAKFSNVHTQLNAAFLKYKF